MTELFTLSLELGFTAAAPVNMSALTPLEEVRAMCEADRCGRYGRSWACPPGCGTLEHTRARIEMYSEGILVQSTAELADEFDYQGIMRLTEEHKRRFADFARQARLVYPDCLPLTAGTCMLCRTCTAPAATLTGGCRRWRPTGSLSATSAQSRGSAIITARAP